MEPRRGRPKIDNPKDFTIRCRIDNELHKELIKYCRENGVSKSDVIIQGINRIIKK